MSIINRKKAHTIINYSTLFRQYSYALLQAGAGCSSSRGRHPELLSDMPTYNTKTVTFWPKKGDFESFFHQCFELIFAKLTEQAISKSKACRDDTLKNNPKFP